MGFGLPSRRNAPSVRSRWWKPSGISLSIHFAPPAACWDTRAPAELATRVPTAANAAYYARIVREKAVLRSLASVATEIARMSLFLTTGAARHITGQMLHVSHGALTQFA